MAEPAPCRVCGRDTQGRDPYDDAPLCGLHWHERRCAGCGGSMRGRRHHALTCSGRCRQRRSDALRHAESVRNPEDTGWRPATATVHDTRGGPRG